MKITATTKVAATRSPRRLRRKKAMPRGIAVTRVATDVDQVGEERDRARQQEDDDLQRPR